eukprot:COSAG01_NODE_18700_length_1059_cov_1.117708_1_plen_73_part_10
MDVRVPLALALNCRWLSPAMIRIDWMVSLTSGIRAAWSRVPSRLIQVAKMVPTFPIFYGAGSIRGGCQLRQTA